MTDEPGPAPSGAVDPSLELTRFDPFVAAELLVVLVAAKRDRPVTVSIAEVAQSPFNLTGATSDEFRVGAATLVDIADCCAIAVEAAQVTRTGPVVGTANTLALRAAGLDWDNDGVLLCEVAIAAPTMRALVPPTAR